MKKKDIDNFVKILKETYPDATCSLDFKTPFQIVVAVMLSAQCTDERVNKTTPALFERCQTIQDFADIDIKELEDIIHPCGFYKNKAKNIKLCAKQVIENFNGVVPQNMEDLLTLAGVGRKSANVILLEAFGIANGILQDYNKTVGANCKVSTLLCRSYQTETIGGMCTYAASERIARLPGGNHADADRGQMEDLYPS